MMRSFFPTAILCSALVASLMLASPVRGQQTPPAIPSPDTPPSEGVEPPPFLIVINRENPITRLTPKALSRIFLKKTKRWDRDIWPDGVRIEPMDLNEKSEVRKRFTRAVHDKSIGAIKSYWQREIFSGRDVPPAEIDSDEEMMQRIAEERGAVGYVSGAADLPDELKVLEIADD